MRIGLTNKKLLEAKEKEDIPLGFSSLLRNIRNIHAILCI